MAKEITRYHNDFNKIKLSSLTELEQNLLFSMITAMRDKGSLEKIEFAPSDLRTMIGYNATNKEIFDIAMSLRTKFFKADFTILLPHKDDPDRVSSETINLFKSFKIDYYKSKGEFIHLEMQVNEQFEYILNKLIAEFTEFELLEFTNLSGKYTKTIYRYLKQYRTQGWWQVAWDEFREILDIPKDYKMGNIDQKILNPAIKELSAEVTLFDQQRIPFKNLKYTKIKGKGRGRGGSVVGIRFEWKKEQISSLAEKEWRGVLLEAKEPNCYNRIKSVSGKEPKIIVTFELIDKETKMPIVRNNREVTKEVEWKNFDTIRRHIEINRIDKAEPQS